MDISIVIPLYKGQQYCYRLMDMVEANCVYKKLYEKCRIEIIFVNDYPAETIHIEEKKWHFDVNLINQPENQGIHASRVKGIMESDAEYIIMLDQDDVVKSNWLYSQWNKIKGEKTNYCVCNGWMRRFRVIWTMDVVEKKARINDIHEYLNKGNNIISPGQVIIRRNAIPQLWLDYTQKINGADDFLLWIVALKQGEKFSLNEELLYYHTPERTPDSVDTKSMINSLKETMSILEATKTLDSSELEYLKRQILKREELLTNAEKILPIKKEKIVAFFEKNNYKKFAIYGMGERGEFLHELFQQMRIEHICVDKYAVDFEEEIQIYRPEKELIQADIMIVCVLNHDKVLKEQLAKKSDYSVIALSEICES